LTSGKALLIEGSSFRALKLINTNLLLEFRLINEQSIGIPLGTSTSDWQSPSGVACQQAMK
jgi:hypothetical protein